MQADKTDQIKYEGLSLIFCSGYFIDIGIRVAEVAREHGWHPPKSLDLDENFKPEHTVFCRELRFVAIYALFEDLWVKNSVSWARSTWNILHISLS